MPCFWWTYHRLHAVQVSVMSLIFLAGIISMSLCLLFLPSDDIQFTRWLPRARISHYRFAKVVVIIKVIKFLFEIIIMMLKPKIIQSEFPSRYQGDQNQETLFWNILHMNLDFLSFFGFSTWFPSFCPLQDSSLDQSWLLSAPDVSSWGHVLRFRSASWLDSWQWSNAAPGASCHTEPCWVSWMKLLPQRPPEGGQIS